MSSMEASKDALEAELQQQKDALASLEEKMQEQKQLTDAQQEAKVALEAQLQEMQASKSEVEAWAIREGRFHAGRLVCT